MFRHIMVPVDLGHSDRLETALAAAADLARHYGARITYVGVSSNLPMAAGRTPGDFADKLARFAAAQAELHDLPEIATHPVMSRDPSVDLDRTLEQAVHDIGADLVVMGSHIPRRFDLGSHGGRVASHTDVSVMLVRG